MNMAFFTNTYTPVVGGVARSIRTFAEDFRADGHSTCVVAPAYDGVDGSDDGVYRLPAVRHVAGSEFSYRIPGASSGLDEYLDRFAPDVIHSNHPFVVGDTAVREARKRGIPLVYTHHTLHERYAYLFGENTETLTDLVKALGTEYANLCDLNIAPTQSIREIMLERGVKRPVKVIPTGIRTEQFEEERGHEFRARYDIPEDVFVFGYLGRVIKPKNIIFLKDVAIEVLRERDDAWFLVVGDGEQSDALHRDFRQAGIADRVVMTGNLEGDDVVAAYQAMDLFVFASMTETQGLVIAESFAAGVPVLALKATAVKDVVAHENNGYLLDRSCAPKEFAREIIRLADAPETLQRWRRSALATAGEYDHRACAQRLFEAYQQVCAQHGEAGEGDVSAWERLQERWMAEWNLITEKTSALKSVFSRL